MRIAIIGYGKMGHEIEQVALERGHEIVSIIDYDNISDFDSDSFASADIAIEFTTPQTATENILRSWKRNVPVVCGTTGWQAQLPLFREQAEQQGQGLFWSSNYSIGVNLFFALNRYLARLMQPYKQYEASISEIHHIHKLDAPSGTAISLAQDINFPTEQIQSERRGEVPGTHIIRYDSAADSIEIMHEAHSRRGFALGAVLAAEFMKDKKGFYSMEDLLKID